jgi:hypothetical protein
LLKPLLLLIFAPPSPDGGTGRRARLKIWLSQGSAGSIPVLGTEARVSAGLSVKEQNILTLKLKLTLFFLGVGLSTLASLWPFLHTQSQTHAVFLGV